MQDLSAAPTTAPGRELSSVVIPLLKGVIYREADGNAWSALLALQARARDYVVVLGLELIVDEAEGYAYLRSSQEERDEDAIKLPRLIARRPLSFPVSLLLALLRKKLAEFDAGGGGETRLVLTREEIHELIALFMAQSTNEARAAEQLDAHINKAIDLGFLRRLKGQSGAKPAFEVQRILKAFVDAQWLADFDQRLAAYLTRQGRTENSQDE